MGHGAGCECIRFERTFIYPTDRFVVHKAVRCTIVRLGEENTRSVSSSAKKSSLWWFSKTLMKNAQLRHPRFQFWKLFVPKVQLMYTMFLLSVPRSKQTYPLPPWARWHIRVLRSRIRKSECDCWIIVSWKFPLILKTSRKFWCYIIRNLHFDR